MLPIATAALLVFFASPYTTWLVRGSSVSAIILRELLFWAGAATIVLYVLCVERRPLTSIGLNRPTWKSLVYALPAAVVSIAGLAFLYLYVFPAFHLADNASALSSLAHVPRWLMASIVLRAAIFEELFYRGFAIERLTEILHIRAIAAAASLAAFTWAHMSYWGAGHLLVAGFGGLILTLLYVWRRDLISNMLAHFITDAVGFLLA
ncbi:MAG TPA: CPBP family intramembrane glutamic endopeptidase [Candidatus Baltobacteraceae bacterium]|nr:CPBP family intramembrane glutamic endopeptidase [Candidatus Baltobacteraceae bacterium]